MVGGGGAAFALLQAELEKQQRLHPAVLILYVVHCSASTKGAVQTSCLRPTASLPTCPRAETSKRSFACAA
jgi:hypothetical protein